MVLIHCKYKGEEQQFLYETTVEIGVKDPIKELVEVHNLRLRIQRIKSEGDDLRPTETVQAPRQARARRGHPGGGGRRRAVPRGPTYCKDPIGKRTGDAPVPQAQATLRKALDDAAAAASKKQVEAKHPLTKRELMEHIDLIRGAIMIAYPMGLPEYDPVRIDIEEDEKPSETPIGIDILDETAQLWWAAKQMLLGNKLSVHVGRNEKTKVVAIADEEGAGSPSRENPITPEGSTPHARVLSQEAGGENHLEQNDEDDYTNSAWANSRALKNHFSGVGGGEAFPTGDWAVARRGSTAVRRSSYS